MSMETNLVTLLKTDCSRVYPDIAPEGTIKPLITWRAIGGDASRYTDGTATNKRNTNIQIDVWSTTRNEAITLIRQVEDAICGSALFAAQPIGEPVSDYEEDTNLYGSTQRFDIWADR